MSDSISLINDTASRLFADLADPQDVNNAEDDAWRQPLWQALEEVGFTLTWVPDELGGSGADVLDGFEVLQAIGPESMPHVIFVTAYDQFAVQAFEVHALDYLLKPFDDERFFEAIGRAKQVLRGADLGLFRSRLLGLLTDAGLDSVVMERAQTSLGTPDAHRTAYLQRIAVKEVGRVVLVRVSEVNWIEAFRTDVGKRSSHRRCTRSSATPS